MNYIKKLKYKHSNEFTLLCIFILIFVGMGLMSPDKFLSITNIKTMTFQMPEFGLMSIAMMITILSGGINLSITNGAALSSIVAAFILASPISQQNPLAGVVLALITCILVSILCGAVNGTIIAYIGVAPMLVTLGTKTLFEGIGLNLTKGGSISGFPELYSFIGNATILGIPVPMIIYIIVIVISYMLIQRSAWGTAIYMVGSNEVATRFSGIKTKQTLMKVYIMSGVLAGIASVLISSRYNSAKIDYGSSYMMQSVSAVVLGGTSIAGGTGTIAGTVIAVAIIQMVSTGLNILGVNRYIIDIITGGILISVLILRFIGSSHEDKIKIRERTNA